jgi:CHAD domain-containing protein
VDVLLENLDAYLETLRAPGREATGPLRAAWRRQRETERERLIARLDSRQYRDFVDDYLDFTESPRAAEALLPLGRPNLVKHAAGPLILAAYERVRAYETFLTWADASTLHALRIEGKRLRYTMDDFAEVLPDTAGRLIAQVKEMQDHLGLMNDADVAAVTTRGWLSLNAPNLSAASREAVGRYLDAREAEAERLRLSFGPLWRRITGRTFRRALGAAITHIE